MRRRTRKSPLSFLLSALPSGLGDDSLAGEGGSAAEDSYRQFLKRAEELAFQRFVDNEAPTWLKKELLPAKATEEEDDDDDRDDDDVVDGAGRESSVVPSRLVLPFKCTECGRCCKTEGNVYMNPKEVEDAATLLGLDSPSIFVRQYASHVIEVDAKEGSGSNDIEDRELQTTTTTTTTTSRTTTANWIRLREVQQQQPKDDANASVQSTCCVFLDQETNYCRIYEARPVQCRTYPFWPSILKSQEAWNAECRRPDDDDDDAADDGNEVNLPLWSPESGGCEGMDPIGSSTNTGEKGMDGTKTGAPDSGVPLDEAYRQLYNYVIDERRFPVSGDEVPVEE